MAWTLLIGAAFGWYLYVSHALVLERAKLQARTVIEMDWIYRQWNSDHGGLYAPVTETTQPNPHLAHVFERDITSPSGKKFTLVNPAYMTRQIHESHLKERRLRGRITSLNPLRPANAPDEWEAAALTEIGETRGEVAEIVRIEGEPYMKVMTPLVTQESCLKCHASQGYKVGDIRGGLSASVPLSEFMDDFFGGLYAAAPGALMIWLVGLIGLRAGFDRISREERRFFQAAKLASLGTLTSGIAHEINNPLAIASGNLSLLAEKVAESVDDPEFKKHIQKIEKAHSRIGDVVSGIAAVADTESRSLESVDLHELVRDVCRPSRAAMRLESGQLGLSFGAQECRVSGHAADIRKILVHLVLNARDAVEHLKDKALIRVETENRGSKVCLRVSDNGAGIPADQLHRIFDPFFTTKEPGKGLGLGLYLVRNLAERMAAEVQAHSEAGKGTEVTVIFESGKSGDTPESSSG